MLCSMSHSYTVGLFVLFFGFLSPAISEDSCESILKSVNHYSEEDMMECEKRLRYFDIGERIRDACFSNSSTPGKKTWEDFKSNFSKTYANSSEEMLHCITFQDSLRQIELHNMRYNAGKESYFLRINQLADVTDEEWRLVALGDGGKINSSQRCWDEKPLPPFEKDPPPSLDLSKLGYVTDPMDQSSCGSCWAFSTIGVLEGQYFKTHGTLKRLSVQQLVDCVYLNRNGCHGGSIFAAYHYVLNNSLTSEERYPYTAKGGTCDENKPKINGTRIKEFYALPPRDEEMMKLALVNIGPISVALFMPAQTRLYGGGVYNANTCAPEKTNHLTVLVGYGVTSNNIKYWLIKNSVGTAWGENGYFKIPRGENYCTVEGCPTFVTME